MGCLKKAGGILCALIIFSIITSMLNYMYVQEADWERILWHNFYEDKGKIDNLYLGSSHVYCGINSMQLNDLNGKYNFNLSSSSQLLNASYYLLKEAEATNSLSNVYLELYYLCSTTSASGIDPIEEQYSTNWRNTDYMKLSPNKLMYMVTAFDIEKQIDTFFPFSRYRANLDDWDYIKSRMAEKGTDSYRAYEYHCEHADGNGYDEYKKQGVFYSTRILSDADCFLGRLRNLDESSLGKQSEYYLRKIIKYCQTRGISITLFIAPTPDLMLISTEHYDNYIEQIRKIASEYNIAFYDFNLAKEEYLPIRYRDYFRDIEHLNSAGAEMFTSFFHKIVTNDESQNKKYFYNSYQQRLHAEEPAAYGLYYIDTSQSKRVIRIASNRERGVKYKVELTPNDGQPYVVQEFMENKEFTVPPQEHGYCTLSIKENALAEEEKTWQINY